MDFICATDAQALRNSGGAGDAEPGGNITKGLGAGANPRSARQAALEDRDRIVEADGADMVFITAGMGGGAPARRCAGGGGTGTRHPHRGGGYQAVSVEGRKVHRSPRPAS